MNDSLVAFSSHIETQYQYIERLLDISNGHDGLDLQFKWQGLSDYFYVTGKPLLELL